MGKINKKTLLKRLKNKCWKLVREVVIRRAAGRCELCGKAGEQVDHCFSRQVSRLFYDTRNLTLLCAICHFKKSYRIDGFEKLVDDIVRRREGMEWWLRVQNVARDLRPHKWEISDLEAIVNERARKT